MRPQNPSKSDRLNDGQTHSRGSCTAHVSQQESNTDLCTTTSTATKKQISSGSDSTFSFAERDYTLILTCSLLFCFLYRTLRHCNESELYHNVSSCQSLNPKKSKSLSQASLSCTGSPWAPSRRLSQ